MQHVATCLQALQQIMRVLAKSCTHHAPRRCKLDGARQRSVSEPRIEARHALNVGRLSRK